MDSDKNLSYVAIDWHQTTSNDRVRPCDLFELDWKLAEEWRRTDSGCELNRWRSLHLNLSERHPESVYRIDVELFVPLREVEEEHFAAFTLSRATESFRMSADKVEHLKQLAAHEAELCDDVNNEYEALVDESMRNEAFRHMRSRRGFTDGAQVARAHRVLSELYAFLFRRIVDALVEREDEFNHAFYKRINEEIADEDEEAVEGEDAEWSSDERCNRIVPSIFDLTLLWQALHWLELKMTDEDENLLIVKRRRKKEGRPPRRRT